MKLFIYLIFTTKILASPVEVLKKVPVEVEIALDGVQTEFLTPATYEDLKIYLKSIDGGIRILRKPIYEFIIKSETYKSILEFLPAGSILRKGSLKEEYILAKKKMAAEEKYYSKFSTWLVQSIIKDATDLTRDKEKAAAKKVQLIRNWLKIILQFSPEQFNGMTHKLSMKILENMSLYLKIASKTSTGDSSMDFKYLKYFKYPKILPVIKKEEPATEKTTIENLQEAKEKRLKEAKQIADKIVVPKQKKAKKEQWKPKAGAKPKKKWTPKEELKSGKKKKSMKNEPPPKKVPAKKGKIFKLEDV